VCAFVIVAAACAVAGAGLASTSRHAAATVTVTASETEYKIALSATSVKPGAVTFNVVNKGKVPHDFLINGKKTAVLAAGKSAKLTVTLKAGKYPYKCTVDSHAQLGMKGTLTVKM
jgi:plastocyanin